MLIIERTFNNNVAWVKIEHAHEGIVIGNGLAFKKTKGDIVDPKKVEHIFYLEDQQSSQALFSLLQNIPLDIVVTVIDLVNLAQQKYNYRVLDYIFLSLSEHISNVYQNLVKGTYEPSKIPNMQDTYPVEYEIATDSLKIISKNLKINFPQAEISSIALHFINSKSPYQDEQQAPDKSINVDQMMHTLQQILDQNGIYRTAANSTDFDRLMIHLQYLIKRLNEAKVENDDTFDKKFGQELQDAYPESYKIVEKILIQLKKATHQQISVSECSYLLIHIQRITFKNNN